MVSRRLIGLFLCTLGCQPVPVRPAQGVLTVSPAAIDFGVVAVGDVASRAVELKNEGRFDVSLEPSSLPGDAFFARAPGRVAAGATASVEVTFVPREEGAVTAVLQLDNDSDNAPHLTLAIVGAGAEATSPVRDAGEPVVDGGGSVDAGAEAPDAGPVTTSDAGSHCGSAGVDDRLLIAQFQGAQLDVVAAGHVAAAVVYGWPGSTLDFFTVSPSGGLASGPSMAVGGSDFDRGEPHLVWLGSGFATAYGANDWGVSSDEGHEVRAQRLNASGVAVAGGGTSLGTWWRPYETEAAIAWNDATQELAVAWSDWGTASTGTIYDELRFQRLTASGSPTGIQRVFPNLVSAGGTPLLATDAGFALGALKYTGTFSTEVDLLRLDRTGALISQTPVMPVPWGLFEQLRVVEGAITTALAWRRWDSSGQAFVDMVLVDRSDALVRGSFFEAVTSATASITGSGELDLDWDGAAYILVYSRYAPSLGWDVMEARVSESGAQIAPRALTCDGTSRMPHVVTVDGVHVVPYSSNGTSERVSVFR